MSRDPLTQTTLQMASVGTDDLMVGDLLGLTAAVAGSANPTDTLGRTTRMLAGRLDALECACLLLDIASGTRDLVYAADAYQSARRGRRVAERSLSYEVQAALDRAQDWALGGVVKNGERLDTPRVFRGTLTESGARQPDAVAGLLVPLVVEQQVLGLLWVGGRRSAEPWTDQELALVQVAGALLAQAASALVRERDQLEQAREHAREHARQLEKLEETNARLREAIEGQNRSLSIRAHDMRAPIGVILGHLGVLDRVVEGPLERQSLSAIRRQGDRLHAMLEEVVGEKRRRALGLRLEPVDLGPWFAACFRDFAFLAHKAGVCLEADLSPELGIRRVDTDKLEEVLGNLIENAIKYSGRGGTVWLEVGMAAPELLEVQVSDSGPGLSEETLDKGFELWFRDQKNRAVKGSGIGLASVLDVLELMGGHVEATNRSQGGASFTVTVPAHQDELAHDDTNPLPLQRYRVVVIDDDSTVLARIAEPLRAQFDVVTARTEREARWLLQQSPVDCAVIDLDVPLMTGFATATALRREPERAHLPVLFVADDDLAATSVRRRRGVLEDVIVRPFEPDELLGQVETAIRESVRQSAILRTGRSDPLTGLLDRKYAEPELERQLQGVREVGGFLSVLLVDVDDLRGVNDHHGAASGDALLRAMGQTLARTTRSGELAARWSGDEFLCVLPGTTSAAARRVADRVADRLAECRSGDARRTVSVGVATADVSDDIDALGLVERARVALAVAREAGGGRVAIWERRPQPPLPDVGSMAGKRLLIVDDDRDVLETLALYFSRTTNLVVETATGLHDALDKAHRTPPQVAIVDLRLPDGTGFELLERLRQDTDPSLPAIAYTGQTDIATIDRTERAGFNACLTKTAQLDHLADEVNRWLH